MNGAWASPQDHHVISGWLKKSIGSLVSACTKHSLAERRNDDLIFIAEDNISYFRFHEKVFLGLCLGLSIWWENIKLLRVYLNTDNLCFVLFFSLFGFLTVTSPAGILPTFCYIFILWILSLKNNNHRKIFYKVYQRWHSVFKNAKLWEALPKQMIILMKKHISHFGWSGKQCIF